MCYSCAEAFHKPVNHFPTQVRAEEARARDMQVCGVCSYLTVKHTPPEVSIGNIKDTGDHVHS